MAAWAARWPAPHGASKERKDIVGFADAVNALRIAPT